MNDAKSPTGADPVDAAAPDTLANDRVAAESAVNTRASDEEIAELSGSRAADASASKRTQTSSIPVSVGPYKIVGLLGRGGMGVVYHARHETKGHEVALKLVRARNVVMLRAMRQEIAVLRQTRHPGIVEVLDADVTSNQPWYVMELLVGETLEDRLRDNWSSAKGGDRRDSGVHTQRREPGSEPKAEADRALPQAAGGKLDDVLRLVARLCEPLSFLHSVGIVHGDLKPANVFLRGGVDPVLVDFGLVSQAQGEHGRERLQGAAKLIGTALYLAPEIISGRVPDVRADLYSLGCLLYEALTGEPPFYANSAAAILRQHASDDHIAASVRVTGVPPELDQLLLRLLAKDPRKRLGHAQDVSLALHALLPSTGAAMSHRGAYLFRPPMAGRSRELAQLASCFDTAAHGGGGALLLIAGESGIGKSFFTTEACRLAVRHGLDVVTSECLALEPTAVELAEGGGPPLYALRQLLESVADRCREHGVEETARLLGWRLKLLAAYEPSLRSLPGADQWPEPAPLPTFAARERLIATVTAVLKALAERQPLFIAIDDLQWVDELSLAVLAAITEEWIAEVPLVIVGTYRSDEASVALRRLAAKSWIGKVDLKRLSGDEVAGIVAGMLALDHPPRSLIDFVHAHSEGVPFFAAEYLRAVAAEGLLSRQDGNWQLGIGERDAQAFFSAVSFPTGIVQLVRRRLSGLSDKLMDVLEFSAVLGRSFEREVLALAIAWSGPQLTAALLELVSRAVIEAASEGDYRFLHDKIRETIYAGIQPARLRVLHGSAAQAIEGHLADTPQIEERYHQLAYHYRAAGDGVRALTYWEKAATRALDLSAHQDAVRHLRECLAISATLSPQPAAERRAHWERMLGDALQGLGSVSESEAPLLRAATLLGWPVPQRSSELALRLVPEVGRQVLRRLLPGPRRHQHPQAEATIAERGRVFDRLQRVYYFDGRGLPLLFANLSTLNIADSAKPTAELAVAYGFAAAVLDIFFRAPRISEHYFHLAQRTLQSAPDPAAESHIHMLRALYHLGHGDLPNGVACAEAAVELGRSTGFSRRHAESLAVRIGFDLLRGRQLQAQPWLAEFDDTTNQHADGQMLAWALLQRAHASLLRSDVNEATKLLDLVTDLGDALGRIEKIWLHGLRAYAEYRLGDFPSASDHASRGAALIAVGPPANSQCLDSYARLAEVSVALFARLRDDSRAPELALAARRACAVVMEAARSFPLLLPSARLHSGTQLWLEGKHRRARRVWARALAPARQMQLDFDEARLCLALARTLRPGSEARQRQEQRAREIQHALGFPELTANLTFGGLSSDYVPE